MGFTAASGEKSQRTRRTPISSRRRHNIVHHTNANITGHDGDIEIGIPGSIEDVPTQTAEALIFVTPQAWSKCSSEIKENNSTK
jgi:hypothetical protein